MLPTSNFQMSQSNLAFWLFQRKENIFIHNLNQGFWKVYILTPITKKSNVAKFERVIHIVLAAGNSLGKVFAKIFPL